MKNIFGQKYFWILNFAGFLIKGLDFDDSKKKAKGKRVKVKLLLVLMIFSYHHHHITFHTDFSVSYYKVLGN